MNKQLTRNPFVEFVKWDDKAHCVSCGKNNKKTYVNHLNGRYCCKNCYESGKDDLTEMPKKDPL